MVKLNDAVYDEKNGEWTYVEKNKTDLRMKFPWLSIYDV